MVGYVEAASGLAALITALPLGYIADKIGRSPVIKVGGMGFFVAAIGKLPSPAAFRIPMLL